MITRQLLGMLPEYVVHCWARRLLALSIMHLFKKDLCSPVTEARDYD